MRKSGEIIKIGLILFAITATAALLLATVNKITSPVISENQQKKTYSAMETIMPEAAGFEKTEASESQAITEAYKAIDASGNTIGVCVISSAFGYGGEVTVLTGVSGGKITGIDILSHSETPGLGAEATKPEFKSQFSNKTGSISVVKKNAADNEINAVSGATITSNAVCEAVNSALKFAEEVEVGAK